jgi:S1-C subfamily serine protease
VSYLGVYLGDVNPERAKELGLKENRGAVVGRVEEGSPAERVGLQENDVILSFNSQAVQSRSHFHQLLLESRAGSKVTLGISRRGAGQNLEVVLGQGRSAVLSDRQKLFNTANAIFATAEERHRQGMEATQKGDEKAAQKFFEEEKLLRGEAEKTRAYVEDQLRKGNALGLSSPHSTGGRGGDVHYQIGVSAVPLTPQLAGFFGVTKGGVLVTEVRAAEAGELAGLKAGDCIVAVDRQPVSSTSELNQLIDQKGPGEVEVRIVRAGAEQTVKIKLEQK